ncbi:MAG: FAD-dependent oxidoreductase [Anaerolineae bacterium]|nr:FAD-dependent oxidoreductase [Anaerolineae bacterium]
MTEQSSDVLIIGAGLSGLSAAHELSEHGLSVTLVDKGRSVGGRLATRRIGDGLADHGAQFFTARSEDFQLEVDKWVAEKIVYIWSNGFSDGIRTKEQFDNHPRYATNGGMNALAKYLAQQLSDKTNICTDVKIVSISAKDDGWQAQDDKGNLYTAKALLLTPPVPQSLTLLGDLRDKLNPHDKKALERIKYAPCITGLFRVEGDVNLPEPGALQRPQAVLSWIADNQRKGISPQAHIITVHAAGNISQNLWDQPEAAALDFVRQQFEEFLAEDATIVKAELKRWRYSQPTILHPERYLMAQGLPPLAFAGDAFSEARVEGAFLSGLAVGEALAIRLTSKV